MANDFYNHGGYPATGSAGTSASARAEFDAIMAGFDKQPTLAGNALRLVRVNAGATALESTNLIDGIAIGSVTPSTGVFTTLSATGNVTLGDAVADTLSVGGSTVKNGTGNWALPAPSAGVTLALTAVAAGVPLTATDGTVSMRASLAATRLTIGTTSAHQFDLETNSTSRLTISNAGNMLANAPSAGVTFTVTPVSGQTGLLVSGDNGGGFGINLQNTSGVDGRSVIAFTNNLTTSKQYAIGLDPDGGTSKTFAVRDLTRGAIPFRITTGGQSDFIGPTAVTGTTLTTDGVIDCGGVRVLIGPTGASSANGGQIRFRRDTGTAGFLMGYLGSAAATDLAIFDLVAGATRYLLNATGNHSFAAPSAGSTITVDAVSGARYLTANTSLSGVQSSILIGNASNTASSDAVMIASVAGSSAGDAYFRSNISGVTDWSFGGDNSDSDAWVLSNASTLGTSNKIRVPTTGAITMSAGTLTPTSSQAFTATPTFDAAVSNAFEFSGAMTANVTSITINNPTAGQTIQIRVKQDGTGGRTVAAPAGAKISGVVGPTAGLASILTITYSAMDTRWEGAWVQLPA